MGNRAPAAPLPVTDEQRSVLEMLIRSHTAPHRDVQRAMVLLMASDGFANTRIASEVGVAPMTVKAWRDRFAEGGLKDFSSVRPGRGRKPSIPAGAGGGDRPVDVARDAGWGDALELPHDGRSGWCVAGDGAADLVRAGSAAASGRDVQAVQRPAVRGEARRCRRPVSEPARERDRALHGREEPDPGAGPHPAVAADQARQGRDDDPRLQAQRHHDAVRRAGRADAAR